MGSPSGGDMTGVAAGRDRHVPRYIKVLDQTRCIGCHACTTACKSENEVPVGVTRTYVKSVDVGVFPEVRRAFQVTRCNQCADAPCVAACPTSAMYQRDDGIVDFDKSVCIGCKACIAACPYDAIFINPEDHAAEKCNFCAHRMDQGLEPACVVVCPVEAILVGDIDDPTSRVSGIVNRAPVNVRRPEKDTRPKVFYRGAHQSTLDPLGALRPPADIFAWAQQAPEDGHTINSGVPGSANSSAAAVLSYDIGHGVPWDWRVGAYTWTKSIGAGVYLVAAMMLLLGALSATSTLWALATPMVAGAFMGLTGALLIWDLEHPERFYYIFTRPQWRSWLVRGGVIISLYAAVLAAHFVGSVFGWERLSTALVVAGIPLAVLAAVYTAFLFAQAKARDLWQNPLLPPHFVVQAVMAGAAALIPLAALLDADIVAPLGWVLAGATLVHLLMVAGELTLPHGTAHARLAAHEMVSGRLGRPFWVGVALAGVALTAPWFPLVAAVAGLGGLLAHEHAYVQAGQSVPLA
jgi:Fe-S-cluster-containing dehydrogenase component/formate-dependent nitrite reductase membrane component NrfD